MSSFTYMSQVSIKRHRNYVQFNHKKSSLYTQLCKKVSTRLSKKSLTHTHTQKSHKRKNKTIPFSIRLSRSREIKPFIRILYTRSRAPFFSIMYTSLYTISRVVTYASHTWSTKKHLCMCERSLESRLKNSPPSSSSSSSTSSWASATYGYTTSYTIFFFLILFTPVVNCWRFLREDIL